MKRLFFKSLWHWTVLAVLLSQGREFVWAPPRGQRGSAVRRVPWASAVQDLEEDELCSSARYTLIHTHTHTLSEYTTPHLKKMSLSAQAKHICRHFLWMIICILASSSSVWRCWTEMTFKIWFYQLFLNIKDLPLGQSECVEAMIFAYLSKACDVIYTLALRV